MIIMTSEGVLAQGDAYNYLTMFVIEQNQVDFYSNMDFKTKNDKSTLLEAQSKLLINFVNQLRSQYKQNKTFKF